MLSHNEMMKKLKKIVEKSRRLRKRFQGFNCKNILAE
jgi:hypothetical protein